MASLSFENVELTYQGTDREVHALAELSFSVAEGEAVALIGPSGCGKSSALLIAAGLLSATGGRAAVSGEPVAGVRLETALILQEYGLLPWKTVADNAGLGLAVRGMGKRAAREASRAALERVGLADFGHAYPAELSGGMRQRLALARVIALDADLLLMDEPLSALDALTREDLQAVLLGLWRSRGHAQVLVTHSIEEAVFLGQRILVMSQRPGCIAATVENPEMGSEGFRSSALFYERCAQVRSLLAAEGALHAAEEVGL